MLTVLDALAQGGVVVRQFQPRHRRGAAQRMRQLRHDRRFTALMFGDRCLDAVRGTHVAHRILGGNALLTALAQILVGAPEGGQQQADPAGMAVAAVEFGSDVQGELAALQRCLHARRVGCGDSKVAAQ